MKQSLKDFEIITGFNDRIIRLQAKHREELRSLYAEIASNGARIEKAFEDNPGPLR